MLAAIEVMRAVPTFFPLPNRSIRRERIRAESGCTESSAAVWVYSGAIRNYSVGVDPATNSAGRPMSPKVTRLA